MKALSYLVSFTLEEGKMYGTTVLIADGGSKSYSLEAGSYGVTLNFYRPGRGVYTMTAPPIAVTTPTCHLFGLGTC